jgi:hypothetical protein
LSKTVFWFRHFCVLCDLPFSAFFPKMIFGIFIGHRLLPVVRCLSVACHEFVPNYLLNPWSDWAKICFKKTRENVYLGILILKFRGQDPRVKAQG